ncbi:hypothetical protein ACGFZL_04525 [Streptomyces sp. NPDC048182]|uniref:hypothetical protein n=1 Tax=Streptomyces sp. NPDC048182 TaxID=3365507 RepID=UPI003721E566
MTLRIEAVGTVVGGRTEVAHDYWGGIESIIRLDPTFPSEVVKGLDEFSHLLVTWHFSQSSPDDVGPCFQAMGPQGAIQEPSWPTEMLTDYWAVR